MVTYNNPPDSNTFMSKQGLQAILQHNSQLQNSLIEQTRNTGMVTKSMIPAFKDQYSQLNQQEETAVKNILGSSVRGLSEFVGLALSGRLDPKAYELATAELEAMKIALENKQKTEKKAEENCQSKGGGCFLQAAMQSVIDKPLARLVSWEAYQDAYLNSVAYNLITSHVNRMTMRQSSQDYSLKPVVYKDQSHVIYFLMNNRVLKRGGKGVGNFVRQKIASPEDIGIPSSVRFDLQIMHQTRDHTTITPNFLLILNRGIFLASCMTHFMEPKAECHYSDLYMGIWFVVAWYLVQYKNMAVSKIMRQSFKDIVNLHLINALHAYFMESRHYLNDPLGYVSDFNPDVQLPPEEDDQPPLLTSAEPTPIIRPIDATASITSTGGWVPDSGEAIVALDTMGIKEISVPLDTPPDHLEDLDKWREQRGELFAHSTLSIDSQYKESDYTPYITWPFRNYPKSFYEKSPMAKKLYETIFHASLPENERESVQTTYQLILWTNLKESLAPDCNGLFRTIVLNPSMRRVATLGVNLLLTLYCLLESFSVQDNPGVNQFQHFVIPYLLLLPQPKYTSTGSAFPGLWSILCMLDRRINPSEVRPQAANPSYVQQNLFKVLRRQTQTYESYNYDNIPSSMSWLAELLNCIISQRKMKNDVTCSSKIKIHKFEQRSKMIRNIVMQEVEKNVNALFSSVTHTYSVKTQAVKLSHNANLFMAPLIQQCSMASTDLWLYLHQGFRYSERYDLVSS